MADYDELVQTLVHLLTQRLEPKFRFTRGLLGDGNGNVDVPERDGFSFVRPDRGSNKILEIFNKQAFAADGTPILIGEIPWQPGLQQVLGVDWDTYLTVGWENRFAGLAQHGETHVWRDGFIGEDPFSVYRRQIFDLRCEPLGSGSTSILVTPYGVNDSGVFKTWPGSPGLDLSAAVPSASGTVRNVLVYWNFSGSSLYGTLGVASGTLTAVAETIIPPKPVEPAGTIPSGYVRLQGGQSQIEEADITDARPIFTPFSTSGGGNDQGKVSKVWQSDFDEIALQADSDGGIGIGTATIPHGGVGWAKLAIEGANASAAGPHVQFTTDSDDYPLLQIFPFGHDNVSLNFDSYWNGANWASGDAGSNFQILKATDVFRIKGEFGVAQGNAVTFDELLSFSASETIINDDGLDRDFRIEGDNDANLFFADGGNDRIGIRTSTPDQNLQIGDGANSIGLTAFDNTVFAGSDGVVGRLILEGTIQADIVLIDGGAAANDKAIQLLTVAGQTEFRALTDVAGVQTDNILVMDHGTGGIGLGTDTIPHGSVGAAKLAIEGTNANAAGPHVQFTTASDDYPILQLLNWSHDNSSFNLDSYWDGSNWRSSDAGSNFQILKAGDIFYVRYDSGVAQGNVLTWNTGIVLDTSGQVGIGTAAPTGIVHAYNAIGGFLVWEYDGLDATVRTVIPNGTGDVLYRARVSYVLRDSAGAVNSQDAEINNNSSVNLTVGTNTVRIRVNVDGSFDIARTAGSDTIKVNLLILWL